MISSKGLGSGSILKSLLSTFKPTWLTGRIQIPSRTVP
jgi:hypothetical protein